MTIKGVMHVHSTYSYDGKESLRSLKDFLMSQGVSFCCLSEHTDEMTIQQAQLFVQECKALSGSQFVFIPGFEVPYKDTHILLIGTELFLGNNADEKILRMWSEKAALTILAHPVRNAFKIDEVVKDVIKGVEIWNEQYDGKRVPRVHSVSLFSELRKDKPTLMATGGLDFHRKEHFGSPLYEIETEMLTSDAIVQKLKNGEYTFGNNKVSVSPSGLWKGEGSFSHGLQSALSIFIINAGKKANALFSALGISLPKGFKSFIRSRV